MKVRVLAFVVCLLCCALLLTGCSFLFGSGPYGGGSSGQADDAAAKSLVRNSMTAIESAYVDLRTFDPAVMTSAELLMIEPTITWTVVATEDDALNPVGCACEDNEVWYTGTVNTYAVGTESESDTTFAVRVDKGAGGGNTFYVDGYSVDTW